MSDDCSSAECYVVLKHVIPSVGVATALWIVLAPIGAMRQVDASDVLGKMNPMPFPFMIANALAWMVYGLLIKDAYVFTPNLVGFNVGIYYTLVAYRLSDRQFQARVFYILASLSTMIFAIACISFVILKESGAAKMLMGLVCVLVLTAFYGAPLSNLAMVIRKRDARSIDPVLAVAALVNSTLWTVYGIALRDPFIWGPNLLGVVFSLAQVFFMAIYYKRQGEATELCVSPTLSPNRSDVYDGEQPLIFEDEDDDDDSQPE